MFVTTHDGVRLNVEVCGRDDAPAILMMHSIGCDLTLWDPQIDSLACDFRIVRYDARGHGGSDAPPGDYTLERLGRDALAVLDAVGAECAYLCGLSLGGVTAKWLALNAPERIAGIVIADTGVRIGTAEAWQARADMALEQGMGTIAPTAIGRFFSSQFQAADPDTIDGFRRILLCTAPAGWAGCCAVLRDADFTGQLGAILTPTVVIGGRLDVPTPLAQAEELASLIPGARLVALDAGHLSNIEQPDKFTQAVRSILEVARLALPMPTLPIIDLSPLSTNDPAAKRAVADNIRAACLDSGFFYIVGHGIPAATLTAVFDQCRRLFALDAASKQAIAAATPSGRGYARMTGKALGGGAHAQAKEEYYLGRDQPPGHPDANLWPAVLPGFKDTMQAYVEAMHGLAGRVIGALALSLDLPEDHFADFCDRPIAALRLVRYPPEGAEALAHTDFGALTLLLQDEVGGLEVFDRATGGWIHAAPIPGSYVVNLGDLFERWTNRLYRSTPHRVVHPPGVERFSAPFFFTGAPDYTVACLPSCLKDGEQPAYPPTTPAAHLCERSRQQGF